MEEHCGSKCAARRRPTLKHAAPMPNHSRARDDRTVIQIRKERRLDCGMMHVAHDRGLGQQRNCRQIATQQWRHLTRYLRGSLRIWRSKLNLGWSIAASLLAC